MSRARGWLACCLAVMVAIVGSIAPGAAHATVANEVVFTNAIVGPESIDVYLDGTLVSGDLTFGTAAGPFPLSVGADHDVVLFEAIGSPSATPGGRSDEPLEAGSVSSQPRAGAFDDLDGPTLVRLANSLPDARWYAFAQRAPISSDSCDPGFAHLSMGGDADLFYVVPGIGGGSGVFGTGGVSSASSAPWTEEVVVLAERFPAPGTEPNEVTGGSFNFGTVDFIVGQNRMYFAVGHSGSYGGIEIVLDCATERILSVRSVGRPPTFEPSSFVPLPPTRLFDTRDAAQPAGAIPSRGEIDVVVTGNAGVPAAGVSAVVMNVTATATTAPGNVRVWPSGSLRPTTANLNVSGPGQTIANLVTVPIGAGGAVSFFALSELDLVADVLGYFVETDSASAGRFIPVEPDRAFDTRTAAEPAGAVPPNGTVSVELAGRAGVPDDGASAIVLNLTGIDTGQQGFVTAYPGGTARPTAANLNLAGGFDTAPNLVIVPLGADGTVEFYAKGGAHLVGDVFGYFTDSSAPTSDAGLFVPTAPVRIEDTRGHVTRYQLVDPIPAGIDRWVPVAGVADVDGTNSSAVFANLTGTQAVDRGFLTAYPDGADRPTVANLNLLAPGATRPNAVLVPLGGLGDIRIYTLSGGHMILDVFGYFTG